MRGLDETLEWLAELHAQGRIILLVTHDMALVAQHADRVIVLHQGQILVDGHPSEVFQQADLLTQASLCPPPLTALAQALRPHGLAGDALTVDAFCKRYIALVKSRA
jgi:ABC-type multidrug transport system ATPase subunit